MEEQQTITFVVPGRPVGKQSMLPAHDRYGRMIIPVRMILPTKSREWMSKVSWCAKPCAPPEPWVGALECEIIAYFTPGVRPYTKVPRSAIGTNSHWPDKVPDSSNIAKGVEDAIKGIIFRDDCQNVDLISRKRFGEREETVVTIRRLTDQPTQTQLGISMGPKKRRRRKR
jgi:Holliday junction resolvase RusA-like endonuclease